MKRRCSAAPRAAHDGRLLSSLAKVVTCGVCVPLLVVVVGVAIQLAMQQPTSHIAPSGTPWPEEVEVLHPQLIIDHAGELAVVGWSREPWVVYNREAVLRGSAEPVSASVETHEHGAEAKPTPADTWRPATPASSHIELHPPVSPPNDKGPNVPSGLSVAPWKRLRNTARLKEWESVGLFSDDTIVVATVEAGLFATYTSICVAKITQSTGVVIEEMEHRMFPMGFGYGTQMRRVIFW